MVQFERFSRPKGVKFENIIDKLPDAPWRVPTISLFLIKKKIGTRHGVSVKKTGQMNLNLVKVQLLL